MNIALVDDEKKYLAEMSEICRDYGRKRGCNIEIFPYSDVKKFLMIPHYYENLYAGRAFKMFFAVETVMLLLFIFLHVVFYRIADVVLKHAELSERSRLLEMQAGQYNRLHNYMRMISGSW